MNSPRKHPQPAILNRSLRTGREDNTYSAGNQPGFCYIAEAEFDGSFPDFPNQFLSELFRIKVCFRRGYLS
jgi:hypothetical protein